MTDGDSVSNLTCSLQTGKAMACVKNRWLSLKKVEKLLSHSDGKNMAVMMEREAVKRGWQQIKVTIGGVLEIQEAGGRDEGMTKREKNKVMQVEETMRSCCYYNLEIFSMAILWNCEWITSSRQQSMCSQFGKTGRTCQPSKLLFKAETTELPICFHLKQLNSKYLITV